ncbi:MAG: DUF4352 domain-containing protein [Lachnospiraceae bacterium]|nr:DUF4352 domain-containing protein [Lachnospiraceae bacterium]
MAKEKPETKQCKHCKTEIPYDAKVCPNCRKRVRGGPLKWIVIAVVVLLLLAIIGSSGDGDKDSAEKVGTVADTASNTTAETDMAEENSEANSAEAEAAEADVQTEYHVGDILMDGDMKIVYMSSGVYQEENEFLQPDEGYQYIYLQFAFENQSETSDDSISFYSFECYADGYSVDMYYSADDSLSATLSAGRSVSGYIYFTVPEDAQIIEVEYTTNYFTADKITFLYEGEQDSGYVLEGSAAASEDAFSVGDVIETGSLTISYLSCETDTSYSDFYQPQSGYHYVTCIFEFENTGDSDEYVSIYEFDCYADGLNCKQSYFRSDGLSATISSGHKAQGTVTFEVPDDATVVEVEYLTNSWTSNRIVFRCDE